MILSAGFFVFYQMMKKPRSTSPGNGPRARSSAATRRDEQSLPEAKAIGGYPGGPDVWAPSALNSAMLNAARVEGPLTSQLRETVQKDADISAGVLRSWLKEERA